MRSAAVRGLEKAWSVITFGCWQIAPSEGWGDLCTPAAADRVVKAALQGGITAFDTAEGYGDGESEKRLGQALGSRRDDVIIISKIWPDAALTLAAYKQRLEGSLRALQRDYVDVYLVHWPGEFFNSTDKSRQLVDIMLALRDSGRVRTVGLSNFKAADLRRLGPASGEFVVNQVPYNLLQREYEGETLQLCRAADMRYMAYSPTGRGFLGGRLDDGAPRPPTRQDYFLYQEPWFSKARPVLEVLRQVASELGTAPVNVALAWVLAQENILTAVVGSRKDQQIAEVCAAGDLSLTAAHLERLDAAGREFHAGGQ
ncbi:MAG: aldo/keto reductase [Nitrospinaceae bacterium]